MVADSLPAAGESIPPFESTDTSGPSGVPSVMARWKRLVCQGKIAVALTADRAEVGVSTPSR